MTHRRKTIGWTLLSRSLTRFFCSVLAIAIIAVATQRSQAEEESGDKTDDAPAKKPSGYVKGAKGKFVYDADDKEKAETIPLKTIDFEAVRNICQPMISGTGSLSYLPDRNAVLVYDKIKVIKKIRDVIASIDKEPVNIQILVEFEGAVNESRKELSVDWKKEDDNPREGAKDARGIKIERGKIKMLGVGGVSAGAGQRSAHKSNNESMLIATMSGHPASIWAGSNIVDPVWLDQYFREPGVVLVRNGRPYVIAQSAPPLVMRSVGSSLMAVPRLMDNGMIEVELYPEVSFLDGSGRRQSVKVESLSTRVTAANGKRMQIGALGGAKNDAARSIFGPELYRASSSDNTSTLGIYLTATADIKATPPASELKPGDPAKKDPQPLKPETPWKMR